jgi:NAD(P)-dependent dehydrogenase (short-subunit alcohol dehydrogenase family)
MDQTQPSDRRPTVFITGTSSGIGQAAVATFLQAGWNVGATLRSLPADPPANPRLRHYQLDVTDEAAVSAAVEQAIGDFGGLDAVVNNAGYGMVGPFETASQQQIERIFATNVFGVMHVMRAALPHFRSRGRGVIVNITSVGGRLTLPFNSIYHATKFAVEGLTEDMYFELAPFGVRVKLVEPGGVATDFAGRSLDWTASLDEPTYGALMQRSLETAMARAADSYAQPAEIAAVILQAASDGSDRLRYVAGEGGRQLMELHARSSQAEWYRLMQAQWGLDPAARP